MPLEGELFFSRWWGGGVALLLCAMCCGESTTKEIKRIYPQKRGSQMRLNFSCMGFVQTDLSCRWKKGVGKVDEEDDEIRIKIILSSCQGAISIIIQKRGSQMWLNFSCRNHMAGTKITGSFIEIYQKNIPWSLSYFPGRDYLIKLSGIIFPYKYPFLREIKKIIVHVEFLRKFHFFYIKTEKNSSKKHTWPERDNRREK